LSFYTVVPELSHLLKEYLTNSSHSIFSDFMRSYVVLSQDQTFDYSFLFADG